MSIDIDGLMLSDDPIAGIDKDQEEWKAASEFPPLPPAATYQWQISNIREVQKFQTEDGQRIVAVMDFKIANHPKYDGRQLTFQRVSNVEFVTKDRGRTSFMLDLVKSAGVTAKISSNKGFATVLKEMHDNGTLFGGQMDWQGFCQFCYEQKMIAVTDASSVDAAKNLATSENKKEAAKYAIQFKNYREFPTLQNGEKRETVECPVCGGEIKARARITRFLEIPKI